MILAKLFVITNLTIKLYDFSPIFFSFFFFSLSTNMNSLQFNKYDIFFISLCCMIYFELVHNIFGMIREIDLIRFG